MKRKIIVIGGGFGGLAIAIRLAVLGHRVDLFEMREDAGGRAYDFAMNGFHFDSGPTMLTMPAALDELFKLAGKRRQDYFQLHALDPFYRVFAPCGRFLDISSNTGHVLAQIEQWNPADKEGYLRLIEAEEKIFVRNYPWLSGQPQVKTANFRRILSQATAILDGKTVYQFVSQYIQDDFLRRAFSFQPFLRGSSPLRMPGVYAAARYIEREWGMFYPVGGMSVVVRALARLFEEVGGKLHFNDAVVNILTRQNQAVGVRLVDGRIVHADVIISTADAAYTSEVLLKDSSPWIPWRWRTRHMHQGISYFGLYLGTRRRYPESPLIQHNIIPGGNYKELTTSLFNRHQMGKNQFLYIHVPTRVDTLVAPPEHELISVLAPVPNLDAGIEWLKISGPFRERIIQFLENNFFPNLRANIVVEHTIDPRYFQLLHSMKGAGHSFEAVLQQSGWLRPANRVPGIKNLYLVGNSTRPGSGVAAVLTSAKIVEDLLET